MTIPIMQAALALAPFSPYIAKWLGASKVSDTAQKILNIAKEVTKSMSDAEALEKLKESPSLSNDFHKAILASKRDIELAILQDKENARQRDIAIMNSGRKNKRADIMVVAAAFGLVTCLLAIILYEDHLPGEAVGIISTVAGIFGSCLKDAYNFEFGSSRGSKEKDQTVASFLNKYN